MSMYDHIPNLASGLFRGSFLSREQKTTFSASDNTVPAPIYLQCHPPK